MAWQLRRRASSQPQPIEAGDRPWRAFERQQLSRQRDALRLAWLWYVLPLAPGVTVFRWGVETELAASAPFLKGWAVNLAIALVFVVIAATNYFAARGLQRRIDQLDQETV